MGKPKKEVCWSSAHAGLSLENYAQIYAELCLKNSQPPSASPHTIRLLTRRKLSQVLKIHGLSANNLTKEALLAGLAHMEMFDPHRSSVDIGDFECDLSTEEMERDLVTLGWVDCPSKSVNGFMPFPESLMATPNPVLNEISNSGEKMSSLTTTSATEGCKQLLPLQSTTTTGMQDLLKSVIKMNNSEAANASVNGFMPFPQPLMSAPNPVFTKISNSAKKISSLTTIYATEDSKQLLPLQSPTTTGMQHLSKSVIQMNNSGAANASDKEGFVVAMNSSVSCESKVDDSDATAGR